MIRAQVLNHLPVAKKGKRGGSKENFNRETLKKNRGVRVIQRKEFRGDDPIKYLSPQGFEVRLESVRG